MTGPPLISWWRKKTQPLPKRMTVRGSGWCSLRAARNLSSISSGAHIAKKQAPLVAVWPYLMCWETPGAVMNPRWDAWSPASIQGTSYVRLSVCSSGVRNFPLLKYLLSNNGLRWLLPALFWSQSIGEALYIISKKNNLVSLMEWLRLTSCCNKNTLKWLEMYYRSSSGCSLAPCSVIAVRLIRNLHNIHARL